MKTFAEAMGNCTTCDVCGEPGAPVDQATVAASWIVGRRVVHVDARVCADNLKRKNRALEKALEQRA